jgi:ribosome biogenesis GTPase
LTDGLVVAVTGPVFTVDIQGAEVTCRLRGRLRMDHAPVVGDIVALDAAGAIASVARRRSVLSRPGPAGGRHRAGPEHVLAANIDLLVAVQAARQPPFRRGLVVRYLAMARRGGVQPCLVVNKCDLEREDIVRAWTRDLDPPALRVSAATGEGVDALRACLAGRVSVLAGPSGVGKTSLLRRLYPDVAAAVGAVGGPRGQGRHTTTASRMYRLPGGGWLVDTPGIRELGLFDDDGPEDLFPDIAALAAGCRFRDCRHLREPGCAVRAAVAAGGLDPERYRQYARLAKVP